MYKYNVIDEKTKIVRNVILWDGEAQWKPPQDCFALLDGEGKGHRYDIYDPSSDSYSKPEKQA